MIYNRIPNIFKIKNSAPIDILKLKSTVFFNWFFNYFFTGSLKTFILNYFFRFFDEINWIYQRSEQVTHTEGSICDDMCRSPLITRSFNYLFERNIVKKYFLTLIFACNYHIFYDAQTTLLVTPL